RLGIPLPFVFDVMEDPRNTEKQALVISDPDIILPDTSYYEKKIPKFYMMSLWKKMVTKILALTPLEKKEQKEFLRDTIRFDDLLRRKVLSSREMADYVKLIHPKDTEELCRLFKPFDLAGLLEKLWPGKVPAEINPMSLRLAEGFGEILNEETLPLYVRWCYVRTILKNAPALSPELSDLSHLFMYKLIGIKEEPPIEKQAYRIAASVYSEPVGLYYGRTYFGEEAKKDVTGIVQEIIDTYKLRVKKNEFLTEETKEMAIRKLSAIRIKMGYPDAYDSFFDSLKLTKEQSFFEAMSFIRQSNIRRTLEKLNKPTDLSQWNMPGHMVNASYDPFKNDITFPAAILQKPFYDVKQKREENRGGIGADIGLEISHAFDNHGSHFDEKGNLKDWWTEEDFKEFDKRVQAMTEQYDGIPFHGGKVNGGLVVSENIADNGGMAVTLEIMHSLEAADFKAYFMNWARVWCMKAREGYYKLLLTNDVHSPNELRANMTPRNFSEWYEAFDVKAEDKMFIPADKRISIW
ncbi:MAG: M13 family metallopeptidase, partial [Lachnospiraceae bacterium]|nr:M13 family metallopeptidase [Lachnospiraceae bacterium]